MNINEIKSVLLLSHEMSRTGAPVALHYMAKQLIEDGIFTVVLSPEDGPMTYEMVQDDILVIIDETIGGNTEWIKWASNFDLIVVNTVVLFRNIEQLQMTDIPVLWWIHDGEMSFQLGANAVLPKQLTDNVNVCAPGQYLYQVIKKYRPLYDVKNLLYYVPDYGMSVSDVFQYKLHNPANKKYILSVGSIDKRKGQDIFIKAISLLPKEIIEGCVFLFVGQNNDNEIYQTIIDLQEVYPSNVRWLAGVSRGEIMDIYRQCTAVVCTSRDDPMPVFMTESMIMGIPVICSDHTGTAGIIKDGESGFIFHSENAAELCEKLLYVVNNPEKIKEIGRCGRRVYEQNFTQIAFRNSLYQIIDSIN